MSRIPLSFYIRPDVVQIARELLGTYLFTQIDGQLTGGIITETEAYCGLSDAACHAFPNKRTPRTAVMFAEGGRAYVYRCYGLHNLFNVVTNIDGLADAVLIRAIEPYIGTDIMLKRRNMASLHPRLSCGPSCAAQALGITMQLNNADLTRSELVWLEQRDLPLSDNSIDCSRRIGIAGAGVAAQELPWRFFKKHTVWVSK